MQELDFGLLSLNVRGLRDYKKCRKMLSWIARHGGHKGITFLQETHSTESNEFQWTQRFRGKVLFSHGSSNSRGVGILFGKNLEHKIISVETDTQGRCIIALCELQGSPFLLINIYAPNDESSQVDLLMLIYQKITNLDLPEDTRIIWGGDFNFIFDLDLEASGGNPVLKIRTIETIREIMLELDLCDIWRIRNSSLKRYTWSGKGQGKQSKSNTVLYRRLDYFFVSNDLQPFIEMTDILPSPSTDHSAVTLKIKSFCEDSPRGSSFWKFNNSLLEDSIYIEQMKIKIQEVKNELSNMNILCPRSRWELIKYEVRKFTMKYAKARAKKLRKKYQDLETKIKDIEKVPDWEKMPSYVAEHDSLKKDLEVMNDYITDGLILRSKIKWAELGEKSNKYFLSLERRNKNKTHVRKLLIDEGIEITASREILKVIESFYKDLYDVKGTGTEADCCDFLKHIDNPALSQDEMLSCEGYLTIAECFTSLKQLGTSKTPGNDGLTKEFYIAFWDCISKDLVSCLNNSFDEGELTTSQKQAVITLIEKPNKDNRSLDSWRPISLINVDSKICSKALSNRMSKYMDKLTHPDQAAFVKDRNIEEPIRLIEDIMDYLVQVNQSLILLAVDFQKAFDSIERNYIFATLKHFGFGPQFIKWIRVLLKENMACVLNNGTATNFFEIKRGTRQGDPISPYIFILVIETLATLIRKNEEIHGFRADGNHKKITLFADDTTLFLKDLNSLDMALGALNTFYQHSSLKVNNSKSEAAWLGKDNPENPRTDSIKWVDLYQQSVKILGIHFSYNRNIRDANNFDKVFENFKTVLSIWRMRSLTLYGRILVVKSLALSKLYYICSKIDVSDKFIARVKKEISDFIWHGRKPKIKYNTLIGDYKEGGLRLPDFESYIKTNRLKWAFKLFNGEERPWKIIPSLWLNRIGGVKSIGYNFDPKKIPTIATMFYKNLLTNWAKVFDTRGRVDNYKDILEQPLWNNRCITIGGTSCYYHQLASKGIWHLSDLCDDSLLFHWQTMETKGVEADYYFYWVCLVSAIPPQWKVMLKDRTENGQKRSLMEILASAAKKKQNNLIYREMIGKKFQKPTAQSNIEKRIGNVITNWENIYLRIYSSVIDTYTRCFQFKILNNCLYLNKDLFRFKLIPLPNCSFCSTHTESVDHLFIECMESKNFYFQIKTWLYQFDIILPELNIANIILGVESKKCEALINQILIIYKLLLYKYRSQGKIPTLHLFLNHLRLTQTIEYKIALKRGKLVNHLSKWEKLICSDTCKN